MGLDDAVYAAGGGGGDGGGGSEDSPLYCRFCRIKGI